MEADAEVRHCLAITNNLKESIESLSGSSPYLNESDLYTLRVVESQSSSQGKFRTSIKVQAPPHGSNRGAQYASLPSLSRTTARIRGPQILTRLPRRTTAGALQDPPNSSRRRPGTPKQFRKRYARARTSPCRFPRPRAATCRSVIS